MSEPNELDVAIIGGGPAGLQAALVLARTRKKVVVFDAPTAHRNVSSHGVHNFVGLDGLRPSQIRDEAWKQIAHYGAAGQVHSEVVRVTKVEQSTDFLVETHDQSWHAKHVILACGYEDRHPTIDGFAECWADTIIPCPFCDGYENRDRRWGIVATMAQELDVFPTMVRNWTEDRLVIAPTDFAATTQQRTMLESLGVPFYSGDIITISHDNGKLTSVTLDSGQRIELETLLWTPPEAPTALTMSLVQDLNLQLDEQGYVAVDQVQRTNVDRLWAAGDVQGWMGAIESANAGGMAATMIVHDWYLHTTETKAET